MARQSVLYSIIIILVLVVASLGGYVALNSSSAKSPSESPTPSPYTTSTVPAFTTSPTATPTLIPTEIPQYTTFEEIRDGALSYVASSHPESYALMTDFSWTCINQSDVFSKSSTFSSSNWQLTLTKLDTGSTCTISMSYSANVQLIWTGSYDLTHGFTEANYYSTLDGPISVTNQPDVRDAVMSYINSTHDDARVFIPQSGLSWTGGQSDYELPGAEAYYYSTNVTGNTPEGWLLGIVYSVTANPTFTVTVNYVGANGNALIYWEGLYRNGAIVETDYIYY